MRDAAPALMLDEFLVRLADREARDARAAAHRMDLLERTIDDVRDIEAKFARLALLAALTFVCGAAIVLVPSDTSARAYQALGPMGVLLLVAPLPLLGLAYGWRVRDRSRVDLNKIALNRKHFLPHGGYYFPPEKAGEPGKVVLVTERKPPRRTMTMADRVRPGRVW